MQELITTTDLMTIDSLNEYVSIGYYTNRRISCKKLLNELNERTKDYNEAISYPTVDYISRLKENIDKDCIIWEETTFDAEGYPSYFIKATLFCDKADE